MRVLITGGGCEEPIDGVRSLCNFSTGRPPRSSATVGEQGHEVTAVFAERAVKPSKRLPRTPSGLFRIFPIPCMNCCEERLWMIIHAAAVSDFGVGSMESMDSLPSWSYGKIESGSEVIIRLKQNPKIIDHCALGPSILQSTSWASS